MIADECYDELIFDGHHTSMASLGDTMGVVTVFTFSKSYAMTGWRVGYVVAPPRVRRAAVAPPGARGLVRLDDLPAGALTALRGPQECVGEMVAAYRSRRDAAAAELDRLEVPYVWPAAASS